MRKSVMALAVPLVMWAGQASAAYTFDFGADDPFVFLFTFQPQSTATMDFDHLALAGAPAAFTVTFDGIFQADGRYCQPNCGPIQVVLSQTFTATDLRTAAVMLDGAGSSTYGAGTITFSTRDPDANIRIFNFDARSAGFVITPVPEPATWAMMIAGFAMTGVALRRGSRRVVARA